MEVLKENVGLLTNYEVFELIKENKEALKNKVVKGQENLLTITYEITHWLEKTPTAQQTYDGIQSFVDAIKSFNLTKAEQVMLINLRPATAVEVFLIVEECEERLNESEVEKLLELIATHLPLPESEEGDKMETD
eukprot:Colp12_sorted_trinity150504_noHs@16618